MEHIEIKELENSQIEITASISVADYEKYRGGVLKRFGESMEVDGFRKGNIPEEMIEKKAGDVALLHEMASEAIADIYPKIIEEKKIEAIGRPEITITKMAKGNPLEFKAITAVVPAFTLPDYKKIAHNIVQKEGEGESIVTNDEVEKTILEIRTNWAHQMERVKNAGNEESTDTTGQEAQKSPHATGQEKNEEPILPELNDEFAKQLGDFKNVADLKAKLKENLRTEKTAKDKEKVRVALIEEIVKETTIMPPQILIDGELSRMMAQFKDNVATMGQKPEEYFKQIKKTEDEVQEGWKGDAQKRVKTQLILHKIADEEGLSVGEDELKKEVHAVMEKYPEVREEQARGYVENILLNEATFAFLEKQ
ncbi:MAG: trigger factor [Candidatus Paceibacterota bacterium]